MPVCGGYFFKIEEKSVKNPSAYLIGGFFCRRDEKNTQEKP